MKRTTILADEALLVEARSLAAREGKTFTDVVREALAEYVASHQRPRKLSIIGIGMSEVPFTSAEEMDEHLRDGLDRIEGWSPRRPDDSSPPAGV